MVPVSVNIVCSGLRTVKSEYYCYVSDIGIVVAVPLSVVICGGVVIAVLVVLYRR